MRAVVPPAVPLACVDVWFQDEARVGQRGSVTRVWALKGTRPRVVRQQQFDSAYLFGAVCPERDQGIGLVVPSCNTAAMQMHLEEISAVVPAGRHGVIVTDGASWHTTEQLRCPDNLSILPLPPYSPELNPAEQVWQVLRNDSLANRNYANYDAIVDACCDAWRKFVSRAGAVQRLCTRKWAKLSN